MTAMVSEGLTTWEKPRKSWRTSRVRKAQVLVLSLANDSIHLFQHLSHLIQSAGNYACLYEMQASSYR
jgi:hypothetical protein